MRCKLRTISQTRMTRVTFYGLTYPGLDLSCVCGLDFLQILQSLQKKIAMFIIYSQNNDLTGLYFPYLYFENNTRNLYLNAPT